MSSLVTYSSEEEEDAMSGNSKKGKAGSKLSSAAKEADVIYDEMAMEMSSDDDNEEKTKKKEVQKSSESESSSDDSSASENEKKKKKKKKKKTNSPDRGLFATEADYRAYKKQFEKSQETKTSKNRRDESQTTEYGNPDIDLRPSSSASTERLKRLRQMSTEDLEPEDLGKKKREDDHEKSGKSHRRSPDRQQRRNKSPSPTQQQQHDHGKSSKHKRHRHRQHRSRSRSHERRDKHRRHRSRSSSRERRRREEHRGGGRDRGGGGFSSRGGNSRQELRNRKLVALGLAEPGSASDPYRKNMPTASAMAAAAASGSNMISPDQVEAQLAHVKAVTGVDLPKYYNPTAINPLKYAEQIKKRQMLWGGKKAESNDSPSVTEPEAAKAACAPKLAEIKKLQPPSSTSMSGPAGLGSSSGGGGGGGCSFNKWETTNFGDSQANEKFRRLMGIKGGAAPPAESTALAAPVVDSKKMFVEQELEYERARAITHTQRGLGLGFSSSAAAAAAGTAPPHARPPPEAAKPLTSGISFVKK